MFAVLLINATVSPVAATTKTYWTENFSITTVAPAWIGHASYRGIWDTYSMQDGGITWRVVRNPTMYVYIKGGQECINKGHCASFTLYANSKWEVLSSSGAVLASATNMAYGLCGWAFAYPSVDKLLGRCKAGTWQLSSTANRIRFTWEALVTMNSGGNTMWPRITRTVSLTSP